MSRLTERIEEHYIARQDRVNRKIIGNQMCLDKLGEIEDLEEFIQSHSDVTVISILREYASNYQGYEERFLYDNHIRSLSASDKFTSNVCL